MVTFAEIMAQLEAMGNESTKTIYTRHGAREPFFGVKVADLKTILKKTKKQYQIALDLYATGNSDAMYLAGLMMDESKVAKEDLQLWVKQAYWYMLSEYTVANVAAESPFGLELALEWIENDQELIAAAGWAVLSNLVMCRPDDELPIDDLEQLLIRVRNQIHSAPDRVRYTMNGFVIAVGAAVTPLHADALDVAQVIGKVKVYMKNTSCKVPLATDYIQKVVDKDAIGKKKKASR